LLKGAPKMSENKIVVKYLDGKIIKGFSSDFDPNRAVFHIVLVGKDMETATEETVEVKLDEIKAVFFVKSFIGNREYKKVRTFTGHNLEDPIHPKIVVVFRDGENFYGSTYSYSPEEIGFFVFPIDQQDNNERVFVPKSSLQKVHVKKFGSNDFDIYLYED